MRYFLLFPCKKPIECFSLQPMTSKLLYNAIRTPDGTILESWHVHDYVNHIDKKTRNHYMVDGGLEYSRQSANGDEEDLSIYWTPELPHSILRQYLRWGTYGKDGEGPFKWVTLEDMDADHINAVLDTQKKLDPCYAKAFFAELEFRGEEMK